MIRATKHIKFFLLSLFILCIIGQGCKGKTQKENDPNASQVKAQWQPIEVKAAVDITEPLIGNIVTFTLTIEAIPEITPQIPEMGSQITGIRIVNIGAEGPKMIDKRRIWKRWYKLQPDFVGSYIIPSAKVIYQDANGRDVEVSTSKIFLDVKSGKKEGEDTGDIRDIKDIEKMKDKMMYIYVSIGIGILILILSSVLLGLWYKKRQRLKDVRMLSPDEIAIVELDQLIKSDLLNNEDFREFYFKLSEILRYYIEARFGFPAQESTTEELIPFIEKLKINRTQKDSIRLLTRWEDLVKFAKQTPNRQKAEKDWEETRNLIFDTSEQTTDEGEEAS